MSHSCNCSKEMRITSLEQLEEHVCEEEDVEVFELEPKEKIVFGNSVMVIEPQLGYDPPLRDLITKGYPTAWYDIFNKCISSLETSCIRLTLGGEKTFYPLKKDIFKAFELCSPQDTRVVIIGQDPYPNTRYDKSPQAMGLSFSVRKGERPPRSLVNIYKELAKSYVDFQMPDHGDLTHWARSGVLLLNTALTVEPRKAGSHVDIWKTFTTSVVTELSKVNPKIVYMLWGSKAQKLHGAIKSGAVLKAGHPVQRGAVFIGCGHFLLANQQLHQWGRGQINWQV